MFFLIIYSRTVLYKYFTVRAGSRGWLVEFYAMLATKAV